MSTLGELRSASDDENFRRRALWALPSMLGVFGTRDVSGSPHLMNISWVTPVANEPTRLVASIEHDSKTAANLFAGSPFSLSVLDIEDRALGRAFVKPDLAWAQQSAHEMVADQVVARSSDGAPYLVSALVVLAGSVTHVMKLGDHDLWMLLVLEVAAREEVLTGPASAHAYRVLGVHDTRMNYGR